MFNDRQSAPLLAYDVQIGHVRVRVLGNSPEEAVEHARRRLCAEMPRMWDLIASLAAPRFAVQLATSISAADPPARKH
ncbi:MAG: hypothetical protein KDA71_23390 [Planctomycetales bacterium]|nr:hypothetical protein [Planctomycetales bacterium]